MCSVIGYIGKNFSSTFVFEGLARLEYRGYDSAGFACLEMSSQKLLYVKAPGQLSQLIQRFSQNPLNGFIGIGHTRWSTHGDFSEKNAHPHFDCTKTIAVVHNGIIENHHELRKQLESVGHIFESSTDTEVITHLLEDLLLKYTDFKGAVSALVELLQGMFSCVIMMADMPDSLLVIRKRSPLCIGYGHDEMFIASDSIAFSDKADTVLFLPDESFAFVNKNNLDLYDFSGAQLPIKTQPLTAHALAIDKGSYEHFMLKEIDEQRVVIENTITSLVISSPSFWSQLGLAPEDAANIERVVLIGCGTSWHAARIAQFYFEEICKISAEVLLASECRSMSFFPNKKALYIVISQSGETADTLETLRLINSYSLATVALTNVFTSTIVREAKGFLLTYAGIEVAVASTKAFSTQLTALYWLSHELAAVLYNKTTEYREKVERELMVAAYLLEHNVARYRLSIESTLAHTYAVYNTALFLGKHISYPFAMESALKLKEIAYVFAESHASGELKHGSLALIDATVPVYIFSHADPLIYQKILSNAHAVHSRGGKIIAFVYEDQDELCSLAETFFVITGTVSPLLGPLVMTGLMQFFMYSIAKVRGCPIDKPRNLAKSVTVE